MPVIRPGQLSTFEVGGARFRPVTDPGRGGAELAVWHLEIDAGVLGAPHLIDREEVFLCTSGELVLELDGAVLRLAPGDAASAPAGTRVAAAAGGAVPATATVCCRLGLTATMPDGSELRPPWAHRA